MDLSTQAPARRSLRHAHGFSLLELLVSLSVLLTLVGIMLPALHHATAISAPLVRCQTNLRALQQAFSMHLDETNDLLPVADYTGRGINRGPSLRTILARYGVGESRFWICAADRSPEHQLEAYGSYVYPPGVAMGMRVHLRGVDLPQQFPVFADRRAFHTSSGYENRHQAVPMYRSNRSASDPFGVFRLPYGCNAVFADHGMSHQGFEPTGTEAEPGQFFFDPGAGA